MATAMNDPFPPKYIDLNSLKEVPESHAWDPSPSVNPESTVPVIDLGDENSLDLIGDACKNWGIFQVVNHNIKQSLLDEVEAAAKALFSLPMQQKLKAQQAQPGAAGYGVPAIYLLYPNLPWMEGFHIVGSPLEHARQLWPTDYKKFCDVINEYQKEMKTLSTRMMWLMLGSLGITKDNVEWGGPKEDFEDGYSDIQLNAYPPCPDPNRAMGLIPHTDSSILTILHQSTSGLEAHKEGFGWVSIPLIPGSLTINVGDLFHILSNGLYKSGYHRATLNHNKYRVSSAYFRGPTSSVKVSPFAKVVDHSHPQLFNPITWSELRGLKYKYGDSLLSKIRISTPENKNVDGNDNQNRVQEE